MMPAVRRWIVIVLSALSSTLCLGAAGMGTRSFFRAEKLQYVSSSGRLVLLISKNGRLDILYLGSWGGEPELTYIPSSPSSIGRTDYSRRLLGFGTGASPGRGRFVNIPYWFVALVFAMAPVLTI